MILVILEQRQGKLNRMSLEALAAAQAIGKELSRPVEALLPGQGVAGLAAEIPIGKLHVVEHPQLEPYAPDAYAAALRQAVEKLGPWLVLLPHTYQVRDFAPKLAASLGRALVSDCTGFKAEKGELLFTRQLFAGKMSCEVAFGGQPPYFASVQAGAFRADAQAALGAQVQKLEVSLDGVAIRTTPKELFQEAKRTVDLSQADIIVSVGRGIKEPQHLELAKKLCEVLGAELGASRPICDSGWLPMERQIGSSGQTVAPKLYLALGISGAIQHLVGMKGSRCVVAVNKDANAPIFEIADFGIVANLFDVVPALIEELRKAKG